MTNQQQCKSWREQILAYGHENILAIHPTTLMFTKDKELTKQGDCIIAVSANKAVADLNSKFKQKLRNSNTKISITIEINGSIEQITAYGSAELELNNNKDIVIRKSNFTSDRTLAIKADKAANDLPREFTKKLEKPNQQIKITLTLT
ncbi:MAG: DUF371 domain-containing protein [Nitrososphaerota archaeon]|jgi:hypothetical protein|uniref:DUF371 domain-containing protein n=1 Tax=Candidatus Bathycorpusculum sp. TaxID=2994959 RepID=UPI0028201672|nr:DUF371 domain-containing protein [Candidatus Termiticorpusculum sp.]MCL2257341.1 DUF371 domain-containing protein [Candidatus Termiticorpusculum sp.]MCL2292550.1 DUF371 domain-containing protein [Candidatus Termiticorpusculum sp.]MDR0461419.1 DUF371 domain-containing protein [Nitrososphaerota archaeon]